MNISKTNDNRPYFASQLVYKCDHCGYLKPKNKSPRLSYKPKYKNTILALEGYLEKLPCRLQNSGTNCVPR